MSALLQPSGSLCCRAMRQEDLARVMEVELDAYPHPWSLGIFKDCLEAGHHCYLLEENEELLVYGVMTVAVGEAHILNLCVNPARRRYGFALRMMEFLLDLARRHGAAMMFLEVRASNREAWGLYNKLGFNEVGLRRNYYPAREGREDAIIMAKQL